MLGHVQIGFKRKHEEVEPMETNYHQERQSILNISMCKLKSSPVRRVEPSLRRSVLIFNTLKYIEHELREEGVKLNPATASSLLPTLDGNDVNLDPIPGAEAANHNTDESVTVDLIGAYDRPESRSSSNQNEEHKPLSNQIEAAKDISASMEISATVSLSQPVNINSKSGGFESTVTAERFCSVNFATLFELDNNANNALPSLPMTNNFNNNNNTTSLNSRGEQQDIFGDIDLSLYDFDLLPPLTPNVKLTPLSAEELMHAFPNTEFHTGVFTDAASCFKNELLGDDLDHIMQVLVGI